MVVNGLLLLMKNSIFVYNIRAVIAIYRIIAAAEKDDGMMQKRCIYQSSLRPLLVKCIDAIYALILDIRSYDQLEQE